MYILGINAYHGDAAAAIIRDGELIAAAEEERFNRHKHCAGFPTEAVKYCLKAAGAAIEDIEHVGVSRDPSAHLHQKILFTAQRAARSFGVSNAKEETGRAGAGLFRQVADRLSNAAKVRDLKDDLAKALSAPKKNLVLPHESRCKSREGDGGRHASDRCGHGKVHDCQRSAR